MKTIRASLTIKIPQTKFQGNNWHLGEMAEKLDGEAIVLKSVEFPSSKDGFNIINAQLGWYYSGRCDGKSEAEEKLWDRIDAALGWAVDFKVTVDASNSEFTA